MGTVAATRSSLNRQHLLLNEFYNLTMGVQLISRQNEFLGIIIFIYVCLFNDIVNSSYYAGFP